MLKRHESTRDPQGRRPASRVTPLHAALAVAVLGLLVMPFAFAGAAAGPEATTSAPKKVTKQLKKLKKRIRALEDRGGASGPAGGDLTGTYPNPEIGPNTVGSDEIADNAVGSTEIAANAVGSDEIASSAVGTTEIAAGALTSAKFLQNFTLNFDTGNLNAGTCVQAPFSRDGVLETDEVIVTPPDTQPLGILTQAVTRNDANEVKLVTCNITGGAIDPPAGDYEFTVIR